MTSSTPPADEAVADHATEPVSRWPRRLRRLAAVALALVGLQLLGDLVYSAYIAAAIEAWEETVAWNADGVREGCGAHSLGPVDDPSATALLLVHGFNASPRHWDLIAPELAERGFAVRVMRLPGFCERVSEYADSRAEEWVAAVTKELAQLREKHDRVGVVAHSLGGATTIGALLDGAPLDGAERGDDPMVDFAVLLAPAVKVSSARAPIGTTRFWHEFSKRAFLFTDTLRSPYDMDCHDESRLGWPGRTPFSPIAVVDSLYGLMDRNAPRAELFRTPLLMVLSKSDIIVDTAAAAAYYERIPSETKELLVLENSGHAIPLDYQWREVMEAIAGFAESNGD
ncbi:Alpha/beta hydrolase family protein [Pseudobythopirellula maris]|uniref:Alpha/beta hydrolase family protein n=1 Tax=Pseudobythopirellula maris TaxID=2527991 RepID=A0A5C5ZIV7_9BACT|nr:alpha/beta fold hydrolase [Pseudobythopirellula maris]TWT86937.1 Alpha/beta hydrolase family protein [Pseudobythopirellula maris]